MRVNNREQRNLLHESIVTFETLYNFESKLLQTKQYFFHTITSWILQINQEALIFKRPV